MRWILLFTVGACVASSFSSPVNQDWVIRGRDRIWWRTKEIPDLLALQEVGGLLRESIAPGDQLLTQDTYLAVEADLSVPSGMELGPFCYYPDMEREEAETLHVLNTEMLLELINSGVAPYAAFSGYGLSIKSPDITELSEGEQEVLWQAVRANYGLVLRVPYFGQAHTTLDIMQHE